MIPIHRRDCSLIRVSHLFWTDRVVGRHDTYFPYPSNDERFVVSVTAHRGPIPELVTDPFRNQKSLSKSLRGLLIFCVVALT
jgi:hypothetical protein